MQMLAAENVAVLRILTLADWLALAWFLCLMLGATWWIENGPRAKRSMSAAMAARRLEWMAVAASRGQRIVDAALLTSLQNGAAFFASACMIAVGGVAALIGRGDEVATLAADVAGAAAQARIAWEARVLLIVAMLVFAFFKFAWAHRLFGYNAVLIGAIPEVHECDAATRAAAAKRAAIVNTAAARSFNRGLRALYFTLGALGWFAGPLAFAASSCLVAAAIYRREFLSISRAAVLDDG